MNLRLLAVIGVCIAIFLLWFVLQKLHDAKERADNAELELATLRAAADANAQALDVVTNARTSREAGYRDALRSIQALPPLSPACLDDPRLAAAYDSIERMRNDHEDALRAP